MGERLHVGQEYLDSKGAQHRLVFLVDEVGQFIGTDSHLMLNLQTITEALGTICQRRAWVVVTSQEDMDAVLGDMSKTKKQDFSKIQGRFFPPLSLSSANVDEVIQSRLLAKRPDVLSELNEVFTQRGDILNSQLTFTHCGMTFGSSRTTRTSPELPVRPLPVPTDPESLRGHPHKQGPRVCIWRAVNGRCSTPSRLPRRPSRSVRSAFWSHCTRSTLPSRAFWTPAVKKTIDQAETVWGQTIVDT